MLEKIKDIFKRGWILHLYYDGVEIKRIKIVDNTPINEQVLNIRVHGHKNLFGKNNITLMVRPIKLLKTDIDKKRTYWGVGFEKGVDVQ